MTDREGLFSKGRNPNPSQPVPRPLTSKYSFCQAGERALHRDVLLWGCFVTRFKTSLPFYGVMPSFTSFGKKTLAVLCLSFKALKCYRKSRNLYLIYHGHDLIFTKPLKIYSP
ncbi:MAG: hypothetical protein V1689_10135 [Pseudomonadota bacterium]